MNAPGGFSARGSEFLEVHPASATVASAASEPSCAVMECFIGLVRSRNKPSPTHWVAAWNRTYSCRQGVQPLPIRAQILVAQPSESYTRRPRLPRSS